MLSPPKVFDSTGIAPNGKLFAGDLNALAAAAAAQADFAQTIDLSTLRIGEAGLTISRIGSLEAQLSGDLRVTKIVRGLEGFIPGAFTTIERDAIAVGRAPYGLAILNTVKNKWEWNAGSDGARVWQPFGIDSGVGTLALRPAASAVVPGSTYFATDQVVDYVSDGATWYRKSIPAGTTAAWFAAAAPAGWVKYDSTNLPSSTGIYADLATHLGGVATPDTRGRAIYGQGTHGDVDTILDNDGLAVGLRRPTHNHTDNLTLPNHTHEHEVGHANSEGSATGHGLAWGQIASGIYYHTTSNPNSNPSIDGAVGPQTGNEPTDKVPNIVGLYIAKL